MLTLKNYKKKAWNELENIKIIQNNGGGETLLPYISVQIICIIQIPQNA